LNTLLFRQFDRHLVARSRNGWFLPALAVVLGMAALHAQNPPPAQGGGDLDAVYTEGMAAFGKGDYPKAISDLETILAKAGEGAQLETVYYTLGAAYFNAGDYAKAVNALETYLKKYPQSQKRAETTFSLGLAALQAKDFAKAIAAFKSLEGDPAYAERALLNEANALRDSGKPDDAIQVLNKLLAQGVHSSETANGAMQLATIYAQKKQGEKAVEVMRKIRAATSMLDNVVRLNALAIELGDGFLKNSQPDQALACYRLVQSKPEVLRLQQARIDALQKKLDANLAATRGSDQGPRPCARERADPAGDRGNPEDGGRIREAARLRARPVAAVGARPFRSRQEMGSARRL
jgi:outer membrane protein assembly factor BamD (BamD/ComL family)